MSNQLRYVLYQTADGTALAFCIQQPPVGPGEALYTVPDGAILNVTHIWDPALRAVIPRPPVYTNDIGKGDFMRRLGFSREVALRVVMLDNATPLVQRAQLQTLDAWLARVEVVSVVDPITVSGVGLMANTLDAMGELPEGVQAFSDAMLAPVLVEAAPVQDDVP